MKNMQLDSAHSSLLAGVAHTRHSAADERKEHARLQSRWAQRRATKKQILRCMELDRKFSGAAA